MRSAIVAEFATPEAVIDAARLLAASGYARLEAFTPYPLPALDRYLAIPRPRFPWLVFAAGAAGTGLAYLIVYLTNAYDYPLDVGGRPLDSIIADGPLMFETAVLLGGLAAFVLVFALSRLPRLHAPIFSVPGIERASVDRFFLAVESDDPSAEPLVTGELVRAGALRVTAMEGDG